MKRIFKASYQQMFSKLAVYKIKKQNIIIFFKEVSQFQTLSSKFVFIKGQISVINFDFFTTTNEYASTVDLALVNNLLNNLNIIYNIKLVETMAFYTH